EQVVVAKPMDSSLDPPTLSVNPDVVDGVFSWFMKSLEKTPNGEDRPDLRAMVMMANRLDKFEQMDWLVAKPEQVQDSMLVAVILGCSIDEHQHKKWTERLQQLMP
ncbi:MAG: glycoside hydrolase family 71 protein, partial [Candidatus Poseidoniaceae archaeon]|nr:glycoside hydrolase family 71 protein [Candidatus Poseidoniaceae archaeon]